MLRLLTPADLDYQPGPQVFVPLTASVLGDAATDSDGFAEAIAPALSAFGGDVQSIPSLDSDLGAAAFATGDLEASTLAPIAADAQAFIDGNEQAVNDVGVATGQDVTPPQPPPPPDPVAPADTGGGGGEVSTDILPQDKLEDPVVVAWWDAFEL